jgi:hypothetical protein
LEKSRRSNKDWFDQHKRLCPESQGLEVGNLVLLHRTTLVGSRALKNKLSDRWFGPYRVCEVPPNSTFYELIEELNGNPLKATFAGQRLKKFYARKTLDQRREEMYDTIRVMPLPLEEEEEADIEETEEDVDMIEDEEDMEVEED